MLGSVTQLPIFSLSDAIRKALENHDVLLCAEPGAGKSTGLPLALLGHESRHGNIILLEPRRLAARSVAARLAAQLGERIGQTVGLRMRGETHISHDTQLTVVTEGVLTRLLQTDPLLEGVGLVIFDEFHERSMQADLGLAFCLEVKKALREDLRLLFMSATLDSEPLLKHIPNLESFTCQVKRFPVELVWSVHSSLTTEQRAAATTLEAINSHSGDILVFLPGVAEIERTAMLLTARSHSQFDIHKLHAGVSQKDQLAATSPAQPDCRRVILSTSLAETSITIDGVSVVIDSGLERRGKYDNKIGMQRLETVTASQASATQRAGRAGRTAPGTCYRLWNESDHTRRPSHWQPEIHRADLAPLLLELYLWGASSTTVLPWLDEPSEVKLQSARELLNQLGLIAGDQLTARGRWVVQLPVHPRLGHMVIWAAETNTAITGCQLAVCLEEHKRARDTVGLDQYVNSSLSALTKSRVDRLLQQVKRFSIKPIVLKDKPSAAVVLAQASPDWIAQRRPGTPGHYLLSCGVGVVIHTNDVLANCDWLSVGELGGGGSMLRIFSALALDIHELERFSPALLQETEVVEWDKNLQRVVGERRKMLGKIVIESQQLTTIKDSDKAHWLLSGVKKAGVSCLPWTDECREWQARVVLINQLSLSVQNEEWPDVSDEDLMRRLEGWLLPWVSGMSSFKELQRINLYSVLNAQLSYQQQILLDECLPSRYQVPSGSRIRLSYLQPGNPILSVRLQEMLGCMENPAVAYGQLPLTVELLSPAQRPVQITSDLAGFWRNSYPEVRKAMIGRYPKHYWPEDPMTAQPTTKAKPRKK